MDPGELERQAADIARLIDGGNGRVGETRLRRFRARLSYEDWSRLMDEIERARRPGDGSLAPVGPKVEAQFAETVRQATLAVGSPLRTIRWHVGRLDWRDDTQNALKAYILACFSELAYLELPAYELADSRRYKLVPSFAGEVFRRRGVSIELVALLAAGEIEAEIVASDASIAVVAALPQVIVVAVRGTKAKLDWWTDLQAQPIPKTTLATYHAGFDGDAAAVQQALVDAVERRGREIPVYFTGHSLGGALAAIHAQRWPEAERVRTPYLFGAPRIGNEAATERGQAYAYAKAGDLVPHLPPSALGYASPPTTLIPPGAEPVAGTTVAAQWAGRLIGGAFAVEHAIERYRKILGRQIGEDFPELVYIQALRQALSEARR